MNEISYNNKISFPQFQTACSFTNPMSFHFIFEIERITNRRKIPNNFKPFNHLCYIIALVRIIFYKKMKIFYKTQARISGTMALAGREETT